MIHNIVFCPCLYKKRGFHLPSHEIGHILLAKVTEISMVWYIVLLRKDRSRTLVLLCCGFAPRLENRSS